MDYKSELAQTLFNEHFLNIFSIYYLLILPVTVKDVLFSSNTCKTQNSPRHRMIFLIVFPAFLHHTPDIPTELHLMTWPQIVSSSDDLPSPSRQRRDLSIPGRRGAGRPGQLQVGRLVVEAQSVPRCHRQEVPLRQEKHQGPLLSDPPACLLCVCRHDRGFICACDRWDVLLVFVCLMLALPPWWASRINSV